MLIKLQKKMGVFFVREVIGHEIRGSDGFCEEDFCSAFNLSLNVSEVEFDVSTELPPYEVGFFSFLLRDGGKFWGDKDSGVEFTITDQAVPLVNKLFLRGKREGYIYVTIVKAN